MADRHAVHPHHVLRALLADRYAREVLTAVDLSADELLLTLDRVWLDASDTIELEEIETVGIDAATLVTLLNPPYDGPAPTDGRRLSEPARDLLVTALGVRSTMGHRDTTTGHLLVAALRSRDAMLTATWAQHRVRTRDVVRIVEKWGRRAP